MIKRRCQKEVHAVLSQFPCILWWRGLSLTWDPASAGDAGRVLTRGGCEMKEKVSSRAPLPETKVRGPLYALLTPTKYQLLLTGCNLCQLLLLCT